MQSRQTVRDLFRRFRQGQNGVEVSLQPRPVRLFRIIGYIQRRRIKTSALASIAEWFSLPFLPINNILVLHPPFLNG